MKKIQLLIIQTLLIIFSLSSQNKADVRIVETLKDKFKDKPDQAVILKSTTEITFEAKSNGEITADEITTDEIMSLRLNSNVYRRLFYNAYSEVIGYSYWTDKNKKGYLSPICGNYEQEGIFHSDIEMCLYSFNISEIGQIKTIEYGKTYKELKYMTKIYFNSNLPIEEKIIKISVPTWLDVELLGFNLEEFNVSKSVTEDPKKKFKTIEYIAKDLRAFETEKNAKGSSFTYPHILFLFKASKQEKCNQAFISSIDDLYKWYQSLISELKYNESIIKPLVDNLIKGKETNKEKIESIFYWIQDNIRYIAFEEGIAGFKPEEADIVLKNKYGDCKGMANLAKAMLKIAGFDARLTWLGTNSIRYDYSIPSLSVDNHMICTLYDKDEKYFLDPTETFISLSDYAERVQGRQVLIENSQKYIIDTIPNLSNKRNHTISNFKFKVNDNNLEGTCENSYDGEDKMMIFRFLNSEKSTLKEELLKKIASSSNNNLKVEEISTSEIFERSQPFEINASIVINNSIATFENQKYIDFDPYKEFSSSNVKEDRISALSFGSKIYKTMHVEIKIPDDYKVTHLPEKVDISNKYCKITTELVIQNSTIIYDKEISFTETSIDKDDFKDWNNIVKKLNTFYNDQVVLEKK